MFKRRAEITQEQKQQLMGVWDILYHVCVWLFYDSRAESLYDEYAVIFDIPYDPKWTRDKLDTGYHQDGCQNLTPPINMTPSINTTQHAEHLLLQPH